MNAGRDVERLIAGWLEEEAADRAPVRVLESARLSIDRTPQRRWFAAWREPVFISPLRLAGMASLLIVGIVGGAFLGRATAPTGAAGPVDPTPTPAASVRTTVESYREARDEICNRHLAIADPLKGQLGGIFDPEITSQERAAKTQALLGVVTEIEAAIQELTKLEVPPELAQAHAEYNTRYSDMALFIREVLERIGQGDLEGAASVDAAINVLTNPMLLFESDHRLASCP